MTGEQFREIRESLGLSQQELADKFDGWVYDVQEWEEYVCDLPKTVEYSMLWIEFQTLKPTDEELADTHRRVEEALERTAGLI
jgi:transcriptional regulator with XRE-family HTH domain